MRTLFLMSAVLFSLHAAAQVPAPYPEVAAQYGVSADALYQDTLARSQYVNASQQEIVWPWTVKVNDRRFQFKSRQALFQYLVSKRGTRGIRYGLADTPLTIISREELWQALEMRTMLSSAARQLASHTKIGTSSALARTVREENGVITVMAERNPTLLHKTPTAVAAHPYSALVTQVSQEVGIDPLLIHAVMAQESGGKRSATSSKGAMGLMQLMPETARALGLQPHEYYQPYANIRGGARYLKAQLRDFGRLDLALAAYNAGPNAVRRYGGIPPYRETQNYVKRIQARYQALRAYSKPAKPHLLAQAQPAKVVQ